MVRFGKRGKLRPRYIGPYEITQRMGAIAYQLALPIEMSRVHDVFHVSMLRKYVADPSHVLTPYQLPIREDLTYIEEPVLVLDQRVQQLHNKTIPLVKVLWRNHTVEETTWESEQQMREQYSYLFSY